MARRSSRADLLLHPNDIHQKDKEDVQAEYLEWKQKKIQAMKEKAELTMQYERFYDRFLDQERQTIALATSLGGPSLKTQQHSDLRARIEELNNTIAFLDKHVQDIKASSMPIQRASLEKEFGENYVGVEKIGNEISLKKRENSFGKIEYLKYLVDDSWNEALFVKIQGEIQSRFVQKMNEKVRKAFKGKIEQKKKEDKKFPSEIKSEMDRKATLEQLLSDVEINTELVHLERNVFVLNFIEEIEKLNSELDKKEVDVEKLKKQYFPDGIPYDLKKALENDGKNLQVRFGEMRVSPNPKYSIFNEWVLDDPYVIPQRDNYEENQNKTIQQKNEQKVEQKTEQKVEQKKDQGSQKNSKETQKGNENQGKGGLGIAGKMQTPSNV